MKHILFLLAFLMACNSEPTRRNADTGADTALDTNMDGSTDTSAVAVSQTECENTFNSQINLCTDDTNGHAERLCAWQALKTGCASHLNRQVAVAVMQCFGDASSCQSLSDDSGRGNCIRAALSLGNNTSTQSTRQKICSYCTTLPDCTTAYEHTYPLELSTPSLLSLLDSCAQNANACIAFNDCARDVVPFWSSYFRCN